MTDEELKTYQDQIIYGVSFMKDGKRLSPREVLKDDQWFIDHCNEYDKWLAQRSIKTEELDQWIEGIYGVQKERDGKAGSDRRTSEEEITKSTRTTET